MIEENNKEFNLRPSKERAKIHINEKSKIAEKAMMFIHDSGTYFFDSSTILQLIAKKIDKHPTIYTNSLDSFYILSKKDNLLVNLIGGDFNKINRFFYPKDLKDLKFDTAFLGAGAIKHDGIYYQDEEDIPLKRKIIKRSKKVVIVAEHQKYKSDALYKAIAFEEIDVIIVDPISTNSFLEIVEEQEIKFDPKSIIIL